MIKKQQYSKKYPSKIILFGEYTVLLGGSVLALPLEKYFAYWSYGQEFMHTDFISHVKTVINEYDFLNFKHEEWDNFYSQGGYLATNIPYGYGLGSSGTVVAAFFDTFIDVPNEFKNNYQELKKIFGKLESYFHGNSSGIDPLITYFGKAIHFTSESIEVLEQDISLVDIEIIDSGGPRKVQRLVLKFSERLEDVDFKNEMEKLKNWNNIAINAFLIGDQILMSKAVDQISSIQFQYLDYLIVEEIKDDWSKALSSTNERIKLCGAGGGGNYLKIKGDYFILEA